MVLVLEFHEIDGAIPSGHGTMRIRADAHRAFAAHAESVAWWPVVGMVHATSVHVCFVCEIYPVIVRSGSNRTPVSIEALVFENKACVRFFCAWGYVWSSVRLLRRFVFVCFNIIVLAILVFVEIANLLCIPSGNTDCVAADVLALFLRLYRSVDHIWPSLFLSFDEEGRVNARHLLRSS